MKLARQYGLWRVMSKVAALVFVLSGPVSAQDEGAPVILALGDSLTQGYGLEQGDGLVPQMDRWLAWNNREVSLINGGVSGDTTAGGYGRVGWSLTPEVEGIIIALGANDFLRGIDPAATRANLAGIIEAAQTSGLSVLLVGFQAPGNYGPDYKSEFDAIYPELAQQYGVLLAKNFFQGVGEVDAERLRVLMQSDGLHPNPEGVALIVEGLGPHVLDLIEAIKAKG